MRFFLITFSCLLLLFLGCNKNTPPKKQPYIEVSPDFAAYVSAYTSGLIPNQSPIKIILQNELDLETSQNNQIKEELLYFEPQIKGKLFLEDNNTLKFIPNSPLQSGQTYTGKLKLGKINANAPEALKEFKFQFQTIAQNYAVQLLGLENHQQSNYNQYQLTGVLNTADVAVDSEIENMLKVQDKTIHWKHNKDGTQHEFAINNINAKDSQTKINININGNPIGINKKEQLQFTVPAKDEFTITNIKSFSYPEPYVLVNFSKPLASEYYDGLVTLKPTKKSNVSNDNFVKNLSIDGNFLKIYPKEKTGGEFLLELSSGFMSVNSSQIKTSKKEKITFQNLFPKVEMVGNGNIIPNSNGLFLPFKAEGLNAVRVEIRKIYQNNIHQFFQKNQYNQQKELKFVGKKVFNKVLNLQAQNNFNSNQSNVYQLELSKFIEPEPGAIYNIEFSFNQEFSAYQCNNQAKPKQSLAKLEPKEDDFFLDASLDDNYYYYDDYYYPEGYDWRERENPCHVSYYTSERKISRNVLASNLGITVKAGNDKKMHIAITDLLTTKPIENTNIEAYDLQNQSIGQTKTNNNGFAVMDITRKAFLITAKKDNQFAYVRVDDGSSLSLSNFNVDGQLKNNLAGFIYGERGVWRPGDDIYLTLVLNQENTNIPKNQPAILQLKDPNGQIMLEQVNSLPTNGFFAFKANTPTNAKTGNWTAEIKIGALEFTKTLKIETIKPNRLKINTQFPSDVLTKQNNNSFQINAQWLSGAKASNLKAKIDATIFSTTTTFDNFANYVFDDPSRSYSSDEKTIFNNTLDTNGQAQITTQINNATEAPGMLNLGISTKVFESGGEYSSKYERKKYSPYQSYAGIKIDTQSDYWEMLETNKEHNIAIASVNYKGQAINKALKVTVYQLKNSWWYNADDYSLAYYISKDYTYQYDSKTINTTNGKGNYSLKIPDDDWGNYLIRVCDEESGHCTGKQIWFDWPNWRSRGDAPTESASLLDFKSDKESYQVGDKAQITIPSSLNGRALVSFENGVGVLKKQWIETNDKATKFDFNITEEMAPNFYVSISMIQPHNATKNDLPIRMYGSIPIKVKDPNRELTPIIKAPNEIEPESNYQISVQEKTGKKMTYTLAVVDEGLLDITNYKTPNIYKHFNQKQALGVKTWDIFNYVLGAFGGRIESVFAIGGDLALNASNKEKISRFKPVVKYLGPFALEANKTKTHQLKMDNYIGRVKVMLVAADAGKYGSTEKSIYVKQPLMVLSTLPRVLNPGDEIQVPVSVFATKKTIKNATVKLTTNDFLEINQDTKTVEFNGEEEKLVYFNLKVPNKIGNAKVRINANSGSYKSYQEIDLEVRAPNPSISTSKQASLEPSQTVAQTYQTFGIKGTNQAQLQVSALPPIQLGKRLKYLIQYPHGCIEQTTSSVFTQLYLNQITELSNQQKTDIQNNVKEGLDRIKTFQTASGGLAYWPGNSDADEWGTNYAFHFILKAENKGYALPVALKSGIISFQKRKAKQWNAYGNPSNHAALTQAYRLFTLALAGQQDLSLMNRLKESNLDATSRFRLASAYYLVGQKQVAENMINNLEINTKQYQYNPYTYGSGLRDQAIVLEALVLGEQKNKAASLLKKIASQLGSDTWYSTQTTAYSLMAIAEFVGKNPSNNAIKATIKINGKTKNINSKEAIVSIDLPTTTTNFELENLSNQILFTDLIITGIPTEEESISNQQNLNMRVVYKNLNDEVVDINQLKQGTDFKCVVYLSNPGLLGNYNELALTQMFPSGWEIINTRVNDQVSLHSNQQLDYQDYKDDRVLSYFDLKPSQEISITTLLNATYVGSYYLPAVNCMAMYDNNIYATEKGQRVIVKP